MGMNWRCWLGFGHVWKLTSRSKYRVIELARYYCTEPGCGKRVERFEEWADGKGPSPQPPADGERQP